MDTSPIVSFLKEVEWLPPELGDLKSLVDYFKVEKREAHIAKNDILMTIDVYKALINLMNSKKNNNSNDDIISLLEAE